MPVIVHIPSPLRPYVGGRDRVEVEAETVAEVLERLTTEHNQLKTHLFKDDGTVRSFVNLFLNNRDIRDLSEGDTPTTDGDELSIVPSIAGGATTVRSELPELSQEEILRYSRHLILPEVGLEGQRRLKAARIVLVGTGGLGSPAALYLAAAGVGTLGLIDFDTVEVTNLQRQIIHGTSTVGSSKLDSAEARIHDLNPHTKIERFDTRLSSDNALEILRDFDIVVDGTDNFPTRYLVNDACVLLGKPNVYGSIFRFEGQASVFYAKEGPCYRCLFREPPPAGLVPSCAEGGVLGVLPGIVGSIQALEAMKLVLGIGETLIGRLILLDTLTFHIRELKLRKDPGCPVCGDRPTITELIDYEAFCGVDAGTDRLEGGPEITAAELAGEMRADPDLLLIDVREPHEWEIGHITGARLIPLGELPDHAADLHGERRIVTYCHHGMRSMQALHILTSAGCKDVRSLREGIDAWSTQVDSSVPRY